VLLQVTDAASDVTAPLGLHTPPAFADVTRRKVEPRANEKAILREMNLNMMISLCG
jgi:hypothetical protein